MDITSIILKKSSARFVLWSFRKIFGKKNLIVFEKSLEISKWKKVSPKPDEKWIFEDDNSFTIEISQDSRDFSQEWTNKFPDKNASATEVSLKINGELINQTLLFVSVDGGRNLVPCPKFSEVYNESYFYWDRNSLDFKVFERIGYLDPLYNNIEDFSIKCGVLIK